MFSNHAGLPPPAAASRRRPFWAARRPRTAIPVIAAGATFAAAALAATELPDAIAAPGEVRIATIHAEGAQVYECKADATGKLAWQFREPIATLIADGKTIGRHFAGPQWELDDGGLVSGKVVARAAGATAADIPLLKLSATMQRDRGMLAGVITIQRLNTRGGVAEGSCEIAGTLQSVPYSADYAFYRKSKASSVAGAIRTADAGAATGNRAPAPKQAATTKPDAPPKAVTDNKAPLGNKTDEPCTVHCAPHGHHGHEH
jgi:Protein of unknown function (DUF3455)